MVRKQAYFFLLWSKFWKYYITFHQVVVGFTYLQSMDFQREPQSKHHLHCEQEKPAHCHGSLLLLSIPRLWGENVKTYCSVYNVLLYILELGQRRPVSLVCVRDGRRFVLSPLVCIFELLEHLAKSKLYCLSCVTCSCVFWRLENVFGTGVAANRLLLFEENY